MNNLTFCNQTQTILEAKFTLSPHCDDRNPNDEISLLVVHSISLPPGEFGGGNIQNLFLNQLDTNSHPYYKTIPSLKVSSHLFIDRDGGITQFVPFNKRAWHAGVSSFKDRVNCNDYSIGIELEGSDEIPYTHDQYESLSRCTRLLVDQFPAITRDRIVGHCDIAPTRKTDPGPHFDWDRFRISL